MKKLKPADLRAALLGAFEDEVDVRQCAEIQKRMNDELQGTETRVRLRNDTDRKVVVADARFPNGIRETIDVSWDECLGNVPEPEPEPEEDDDDPMLVGSDSFAAEYTTDSGKTLQLGDIVREAVRRADKSSKQWNNLKQETRDRYIQSALESLMED